MRQLGMNALVQCDECAGSGSVYAEECEHCGGTGRTRELASFTVRIPAGVRSGQTLRLRGKGMPRFGGYGRGDQIVTIQLEVPTALTEEQRALVEQLAQSMGEDTHSQRRTFLEKLKGFFD